MEIFTLVTDASLEQYIRDWQAVQNSTDSDAVYNHAEDQANGMRRELAIRHAYDMMSAPQCEVFAQWVEHFGEDEAARKVNIITESDVRGDALLRGYRGVGRHG